MRFGFAIAVLFLAAYFVDGQFYGGKFSGAASEIASRAIHSFNIR